MTIRWKSLGLLVGAGALAAWAGWSEGDAHAQPASSAAPGASAAPKAPAKAGTTVQTYEWPTTASEEPASEAWDSAIELESVTTELPNEWWRVTDGRFVCTQRVVKEWLRIVCTPNAAEDEHLFIGVVWGMAGAVEDAKGFFTVAGQTPEFRKPIESSTQEMVLKMGVKATVTLPVRPGTSSLLSFDEIGWDFQYDGGSNVYSRSGVMVDISWAKGEQRPTILFR